MTSIADPPATSVETSALAPYVPRLVEEHQQDGGGSSLLVREGTLVSADISGFTALSERLAEFGHEGAEQLTDLLNRCFAEMIEVCERRHGDVIKFGGDALLVLFTGEDHAVDAAVSMAEMHRIVSRDWETDSVKRVPLGISQGAHSGPFGFTIADTGHLELMVGGPAVSETVTCEGNAGRGQVLVSADTAALLPDDWMDDATEDGARPLRTRRVLRDGDDGPAGPGERVGIDGLQAFLPEALAEQVVAGVPGEHRQVVVAFVNVSGIDDLNDERGPLAVYEVAQAIAANVKEVLSRHAVHLIATDAYVNGTKLILTAGAPLSTDADDDHMLLALHDLFAMDNPLPMKAGVNRGHVFVGDLGGPTRRAFTVMGDAVNLAARLMQHAGTGQIVASREVIDRAQVRFDADDLEPFFVKGKTQPIQAAVVGEPHYDDSDQHIGYVKFVGRSNELVRLDELATTAAAGRGCVVEVTGEPGIGKSRLVREVREAHGELEQIRMRGGQYARSSPFFVVRRLMHRAMGIERVEADNAATELTRWVEARAPELLPWLPLLAIPFGAEVPMTDEVERLAEQFRRDRLIRVTADAIEQALDRPVSIIAEDAHLFDTGSLDVMRALGLRVADHPWFMVATHRESGRLLNDHSEMLALEALAEDELSALAAGAGDATDAAFTADQLDRLAARAGGNPLFLLELVSAAASAPVGQDGSSELPESVESLLTTRIDRMPARDRMLLREASVSGNVVDAEIMAEAFDQPDLGDASRWEPLTAFLVQETDSMYRFRYSLYREVAYSGLSYRRRREAHLAFGRTIERRVSPPSPSVATLLSDHFDRGRDRQRAWRYSVVAGDAAREAYANTEAVTLYERALRNADAAVGDEEGRVAEALGDVSGLRGHYGDAFEAFQRSRSQRSGQPESEVRLLRKIGTVRLREGELSQSLRWFTRARKALDQLDPGRLRDGEEAEIAVIRAGALHRQGRNQECVAWAETAAEAATAADEPATLARSYNILEVAYRTLGRVAEAAECSDLALQHYAGTGDLVGEANVLNNQGIQLHFAGRWSEAIEAYERSRELRRQAGDVVGEALVANNIAEIHSLQNRFDAAREGFEFARGEWEDAGNSLGVAYATANLGVLAARAGDAERGLELLDEAAASMEQLGVSSLLLGVQRDRVECQLLLAEPQAAVDEATALVNELTSGHVGDEQLELQAELLLGVAQLRSGSGDTATVTLNRVLERSVAQHDRYVEAMCLLGVAEAERALQAAAPQRLIEADRILADLDVAGRPTVFERR